jgi:hypothetical protein
MAMSSLRDFFIRLLVVAAVGVTAGCSLLKPKPDLARYYRLDVLPEKISPAPPPDPTLALAVFPANLPPYLDYPQMVTDVRGNQVNHDEYHRWAEPLDAGFSRVLARDIGLLADSTHVAAFPLSPGFGQEFEVYVTLDQFDGMPGGNVTLRASWRITGPGGKPTYYTHETTSTRQAEVGADPADGYVAALNGLLGDLARDIVSAVPEARSAKMARAVATP